MSWPSEWRSTRDVPVALDLGDEPAVQGIDHLPHDARREKRPRIEGDVVPDEDRIRAGVQQHLGLFRLEAHHRLAEELDLIRVLQGGDHVLFHAQGLVQNRHRAADLPEDEHVPVRREGTHQLSGDLPGIRGPVAASLIHRRQRGDAPCAGNGRSPAYWSP